MLQSGLTCPSISICPLSATGELFMTKENPGSFSLVNPWMRTHHPRAWPYNFIVNAGPCLAWLCARIPKWPYIRLLPQPVFPPAHSPPSSPPSAGLASALFTFLDAFPMPQQHGHSPVHTQAGHFPRPLQWCFWAELLLRLCLVADPGGNLLLSFC